MNQSGCKSKVGLLFLRDCNRPVHGQCKKCNRPICKEHRIKIEDQGAYCTECANALEEDYDDPALYRTSRRYYYYDSYGYEPIYYGSHRYYSDHDYRTFDDRDEYVVDPDEGMAEDAAFGDEYMES